MVKINPHPKFNKTTENTFTLPKHLKFDKKFVIIVVILLPHSKIQGLMSVIQLYCI